MSKKIILLLVGLCLMLTQGTALAGDSALDTIQKNGELRVGFDSGYIPFEMTSKKGSSSVLISTSPRPWPRP
jgi:polar amino acid transport system substrate-binding protein